MHRPRRYAGVCALQGDRPAHKRTALAVVAVGAVPFARGWHVATGARSAASRVFLGPVQAPLVMLGTARGRKAQWQQHFRREGIAYAILPRGKGAERMLPQRFLAVVEVRLHIPGTTNVLISILIGKSLSTLRR